MKQVDIVLLSYAKNDLLKKTTENAVQSLFRSEDDQYIQFNTLVIESNKNLEPFSYPGTRTIYPAGNFGFNKYLNIGIKNTANEYICFCNNDVIFHTGWASHLIEQFESDAELMSASPVCSVFHPSVNMMPNSGNYYGYAVRKEIAGWCLFVKRDIFNTIGLFDENFKFWFADADYAKTLQKHNLKHALVSSSVVDHLDGMSTAELDASQKLALTSGQYWYFQYKWEHHNRPLYFYRKLRSNLRIFNKR